jgi:sterol 3beta-glucosyltransferase
VKVLILTLGTRGDVQPFVALARGLTDAGHEAALAAPHRFARFVGERGVTFAGIDDGPLRLMDGDADSGTVVDVASGGLSTKLALARRMRAMFTAVLEDSWSVASEEPGAGADVLVHNGQVMAGQHVAERLGIPAVLASPIPVYVPTREFSWPGVAAPAWLPRALNRATYLGMKGPAMMFGRLGPPTGRRAPP